MLSKSVLSVGWLVARVLRATACRVIERFSKRIAATTTKAAWQQVLADKGFGRIVSSSIYWLVLSVAVMVTSEVVGLPVLTTYLAALAHYLPKVIVAVAVSFADVVGGRLVSEAATSTARIRGGNWPASSGASSSARPFSWQPSNSEWMYRC